LIAQGQPQAEGGERERPACLALPGRALPCLACLVRPYRALPGLACLVRPCLVTTSLATRASPCGPILARPCPVGSGLSLPRQPCPAESSRPWPCPHRAEPAMPSLLPTMTTLATTRLIQPGQALPSPVLPRRPKPCPACLACLAEPCRALSGHAGLTLRSNPCRAIPSRVRPFPCHAGRALPSQALPNHAMLASQSRP
jgi:hypothetical protein